MRWIITAVRSGSGIRPRPRYCAHDMSGFGLGRSSGIRHSNRWATSVLSLAHGPSPVGGSVQKQSGDRTNGDDVGLSDLEAQQDGKGQDGDDAGGHVDDGLAGED